MKKILCILLLFVMLCSLFPSVQASEGQTDLSLCVGADESQMNVTWYATSGEPGSVLLSKVSDLVGGELPREARSFPSHCTEANDPGYYSHKTTLTGLESGTDYVYVLVNGELRSPMYSFTTAPEGDFSFMLLGDPQLGGSKDLEKDTAGWAQTLERIRESFSDTAFLLTAGDHVNSKDDEEQFDALLHHELLSSIPFANVIGNHESGSDTFAQHFYRPNESTEYGVKDAGGDAYFLYHGVLFFLINSNDRDAEEHRTFMEEVLAKHPDATWKIVGLHHSLYTVANHAEDEKILSRREDLVPLFQELDIDLVLMGHDHVYCRSYVMEGLKPVTDPDLYDKRDYSAVSDPKGVVYLTANSSSGSKTYSPEDEVYPYSAAQHQYKGAEITRIYVSDSYLRMDTYLAEDLRLLDSFVIRKQTPVELPFRDVGERDWFCNAVTYNYRHGLMKGVSQDSFSPELSLSRGMFVTMLYRLSGASAQGTSSFTDVPKNAYYSAPVAWASEKSIVKGVNKEHFAPDVPITREQMLTMIFRYCSGTATDTELQRLASFADGTAVSSYARQGMAWGLAQGLLVGNDKGELLPQGTATRSQSAQIFMRLHKLLKDPIYGA